METTAGERGSKAEGPGLTRWGWASLWIIGVSKGCAQLALQNAGDYTHPCARFDSQPVLRYLVMRGVSKASLGMRLSVPSKRPNLTAFSWGHSAVGVTSRGRGAGARLEVAATC